MKKIKKICVISGSRAEYGLLHNLLIKLKKKKNIKLQIVVTGMHLSTEFGLTYREIIKDKFKLDKKIEIVMSSDTPESICKSTGLGIISFSDAFKDLRPDMIVLLGDRYELLSAAFTALVMRIPIAHIHGGEVTIGAFDDAIRHSISKMSWIHFVSHKTYKNRLIQLGENPSNIFNFGGLGAERVKEIKKIEKKDLESFLGIKLKKNKLLMITFHPITLDKASSLRQFKNLLKVLNGIKDKFFIFTLPNSDTDGRIIIDLIKKFVSQNKHRSKYYTSLGQKKYFSLINYCYAVVGNSSSGILEVPSFRIPTINIGDRQKGRVMSDSVINCNPTISSIEYAFKKIKDARFFNKLRFNKNPYFSNNTSLKISNKIANIKIPQNTKKTFFDLK